MGGVEWQARDADSIAALIASILAPILPIPAAAETPPSRIHIIRAMLSHRSRLARC